MHPTHQGLNREKQNKEEGDTFQSLDDLKKQTHKF